MNNEGVRSFELPTEQGGDAGERFVVHTKHLGPLRELLNNPKAEQVAEDGVGETPVEEHVGEHEGVEQLVSVFENMHIRRKTAHGVVERKPRLLISGGFVRDVLLGEKPKDIDFSTDATYEEITEAIQLQLESLCREGKLKFQETGTPGGAYRVLRVTFAETPHSPRAQYEIATFRTSSDAEDTPRDEDGTEGLLHPGDDAQRRDFTINALHYNVSTGNVIDYVGGLQDLEDKTLRFVGDPEARIAEDKLRMLRYVRFLAKTNFAPDEGAVQAIQHNAESIQEVSGERIRDELDRMLRLAPGDALRNLERLHLLERILPEVSVLRECPQGPPYHMEGDVLEHTMLVLDNLKKDMQERDEWASPELLLATVLHDIGKPEKRAEKIVEMEINGEMHTEKKVSFIGHDIAGARLACDASREDSMANRLRLSNDSRNKIQWIIENHQKIFALPEMGLRKAVALAEHPAFADLLTMARADRRSGLHSNPVEQAKKEQKIEELMARAEEVVTALHEWKEYLEEVQINQYVNGRVIMERFSIPGGFHLKIIKERVEQLLFAERPIDRERIEKCVERVVRGVCKENHIPMELPSLNQ